MILDTGLESTRAKRKEKGEIRPFTGTLLLVPFRDVKFTLFNVRKILFGYWNL